MTGTMRRWLLSLAFAGLCAVGIIAVQPRLAEAVKQTKRDELSVLPPPAQLRAMTFGYTTVGADLVWAKLVVEHGVRFEEQRTFPELPQFLDGVIALDPDHPIIYQFLDTLLVYKPGGGNEDDARLARRYLERAATTHPLDPDIWLQYGQFIAFLAPSFLKDQAERDLWRKEGALAIARAIELGASADRTLAVSSILSKAGEREAAIKQLQRHYALSDDPKTRREISFQLQKLEATADAEGVVQIVEHQWRTHYSATSRNGTLLIGPHRSPALCAGPQSYTTKGCARDWTGATIDAR